MRLILSVVVAIVMAMIASRKGFNPLLWMLAGGIPGFLILMAMPSASADDIDDVTRITRRRRGNITGGAISCVAVTVMIGVALWLASQ